MSLFVQSKGPHRLHHTLSRGWSVQAPCGLRAGLARSSRPRIQHASATASAESEVFIAAEERIVKTQKQLRLKIGATAIPHPDKAHYGGEDAHFTSDVMGGALGVADGVGGWAESGINPAEYSRSLMKVACAWLEGEPVTAVTLSHMVSTPQASNENGPMPAASSPPLDLFSLPIEGEIPPKAALAVAHAATRLPGSATACILVLDQTTETLTAANLGDSGFLLVRKGKPLVRSEALQHFFDCPLQLGAYPEFTNATDSVDDAAVYQLKVQPGDIVIAGSDGLWDNCYEDDIMSLLPDGPDAIEMAARQVAELAHSRAQDPTYRSPYSQEAVKNGYDLPWWEKLRNVSLQDGKIELGQLQGGKLDDVTVIVAYVTEEEVPLLDDEPEGSDGLEATPLGA
eukprot:jgi/Botrbrau1/19597/Bobra.0035s0075.1